MLRLQHLRLVAASLRPQKKHIVFRAAEEQLSPHLFRS